MAEAEGISGGREEKGGRAKERMLPSAAANVFAPQRGADAGNLISFDVTSPSRRLVS